VRELAVKKSKLKQQFALIAPKVFGNKEIGTTFAAEPAQLIGRKVIVSAIDLTNNFSKYYVKFILAITKVDGKNAFTEVVGSECLRDYIARMVVRRVRRIDTVQNLETKDGVRIRVKGITIIGRRVKSSIQKQVRTHVSKMIEEFVKQSTFEEFIKKVISDEIKNKILKDVSKTYPLRHFEIRKFETLK
jgi:small subunit ribosomal protein S3Ae